jgi:transposase
MYKKELAEKYNISVKTLNKWLKPFEKKIGKVNGYFFNPKQIKIIYECLGEP